MAHEWRHSHLGERHRPRICFLAWRRDSAAFITYLPGPVDPQWRACEPTPGRLKAARSRKEARRQLRVPRREAPGALQSAPGPRRRSRWKRRIGNSEVKDDLVQDILGVLTAFCARRAQGELFASVASWKSRYALNSTRVRKAARPDAGSMLRGGCLAPSSGQTAKSCRFLPRTGRAGPPAAVWLLAVPPIPGWTKRNKPL